MTEVLPFQHKDWNIRVLMRGDEPWFVAKDVCDVLEHTNHRVALERLDDDEKGVSKVYTPGGEQVVAIVDEAGLYSLVLRSNKPEAKSFKRWITHDLLPTLRKTGTYQMPNQRLDSQHTSPDDEEFQQVIRVMNRVFQYQDQMTSETFGFFTQKVFHRWLEACESSGSGQMLYSPGDLSELLEISVEDVKDIAEKNHLLSTTHGRYVTKCSPLTGVPMQLFYLTFTGAQQLATLVAAKRRVPRLTLAERIFGRNDAPS